MHDPRNLEPIAARAWRAAEESAIGGWRLNAASGYSGRINACWPMGDPELPLDAAIDAVEAWYAARGLRSLFKIVESACAPKGLVRRLEARGYRPRTETLMMIGPLRGESDPAVALAAEADAGFEAVFNAAGSGDAGDARERLEALARVPAPRAFARLDVGGGAAAIGASAVEGRWAGVFAMRTDPRHRRQGLGRRVFNALTSFARTAGASQGYLQVEADNAPAVALYQAEGFEEAYRYGYWEPASEA